MRVARNSGEEGRTVILPNCNPNLVILTVQQIGRWYFKFGIRPLIGWETPTEDQKDHSLPKTGPGEPEPIFFDHESVDAWMIFDRELDQGWWVQAAGKPNPKKGMNAAFNAMANVLLERDR